MSQSPDPPLRNRCNEHKQERALLTRNHVKQNSERTKMMVSRAKGRLMRDTRSRMIEVVHSLCCWRLAGGGAVEEAQEREREKKGGHWGKLRGTEAQARKKD